MDLRSKQSIDYYLGSAIIFLIRPVMVVWNAVMGRRTDHPAPPRKMVVLKLMGGGSLVIALPALLGIRQRYPACRIELVTLGSTAAFARLLGVFDEIHVVDGDSLWGLARSLLRARFRCRGADTVIDLEVYSRLSTIFALLLFARERIGFYLGNRFWRMHLSTRLIFFNRAVGTYFFYDQIAALLDAPVAGPTATAEAIRRQIPAPSLLPPTRRRIALGHACSDFGRERMLSPAQWAATVRARCGSEAVEFVVLGAAADRDFGDRIIQAIGAAAPQHTFINLCGKKTLGESVAVLWSADEFWGVDSGLLHFARLGGRRCVSFWGPTDPATRLRPINGLDEEVVYRRTPCSPCIHVADVPPCHGNNRCIEVLFGATSDDPLFAVWPPPPPKGHRRRADAA